MTGQTPRVRAIVFDWAGTMIDYGSRAPASVFRSIFEQEGVPITAASAREPMGMAKRAHIKTVLEMPAVQAKWQEVKGEPGGDVDVDRMYEKFLPLQKATLLSHSELIPGARETAQWCSEHDIQVAGTTGYTRELMEVVQPLAAKQGYTPLLSLAAEDAPEGRPAPWMIFEIAKQFGVYPMSQIVKVDDTTVGIRAGLNAGCWTVGVTKSGNEVGLSEAEVNSLPLEELAQRVAQAEVKFRAVGAHFVVESVADIPDVVGRINDRLLAGDSPGAV
jgi:phosphonoacetaldehyde hydrolase